MGVIKMKRIFIALLLLFFLISPVLAQDKTVVLGWDPNSETDIAGYRAYYGTASRNYTVKVDVGNVITCEIPGLAVGTVYYFAVTAYNTSGLESDYSNEVSVNLIPPETPTGCSVRIK